MSSRCTRCLPIFSANAQGLAAGGYASLRRAYCEETYCPERDCRYILAACAAVLGIVIGAVTMRCGRKWLR